MTRNSCTATTSCRCMCSSACASRGGVGNSEQTGNALWPPLAVGAWPGASRAVPGAPVSTSFRAMGPRHLTMLHGSDSQDTPGLAPGIIKPIPSHRFLARFLPLPIPRQVDYTVYQAKILVRRHFAATDKQTSRPACQFAISTGRRHSVRRQLPPPPIYVAMAARDYYQQGPPQGYNQGGYQQGYGQPQYPQQVSSGSASVCDCVEPRQLMHSSPQAYGQPQGGYYQQGPPPMQYQQQPPPKKQGGGGCLQGLCAACLCCALCEEGLCCLDLCC